MEVDPDGYVDGPNAYQFVLDNPVDGVDPTGQERRIDVVPKPDQSQHPGTVGKDQVKPNGNDDKKGNAPIWWARFYSRYVNWISSTLDTSSVEDMIGQIKNKVGDPSKSCNRVSRLVIRAHGNSSAIQVGDNSGGTVDITIQNADTLSQLKGYFSDDAEIVIWACNVGQNQALLQKIADATGVKVTAFTATTGQAFNPFGSGEWVTVYPTGKGPPPEKDLGEINTTPDGGSVPP